MQALTTFSAKRNEVKKIASDEAKPKKRISKIRQGDVMSDLSVLNAAIQKESVFIEKMFNEVSKVVVGQREMIEGILMGLLTGGHVLLEESRV